MKLSKPVKNILLVIMTILSLSVFFVSLNIVDVSSLEGNSRIIKFLEKCSKSFNGYNVAYIPMFIAFYYFYAKTYFDGRKINKVAMILAVFFSVSMVFGYSYSKDNSWNLIFSSNFQFMKSVIVALGYYSMFYIIIKKLYIWLDNYTYEKSDNKILNFIFEKHSFIMPFMIILLFWLPYIIFFYPGTTAYGDTMSQIYQIYHIDNWTVKSINLISEDVYINNHHPVMHTLLLGGFIKIGELLNNYNIGMFLYTVTQVIITNIVLSFTFVWMKKRNIPIWVRILTLTIYSIISFFPLCAINASKDTYASIFTVIYILMLFDIIIDNNKLKKKRFCFGLMIIMLLIMLFRNDGIYRVVIPFLIFIIANKIEWKRMLIMLIVPVLIFEIYSNCLLPAFKISAGSKREMLSIPFQQTARVVYEHGYEAYSEEDKQKISKILRYDTLAENYTPTFSDPVKNKFNKNSTKKELMDYFKVWISNFFKYPTEYIQATLNNIYGYFYPNISDGIGYTDIRYLDDGRFNIKFVDKWQNYRATLSNSDKVMKNIVIVGMLYSEGFYVYALLIVTGYIVYKREYKFISTLFPLYIILAVCIASPLNGHWRYMLPIIMMFPIIIAITMYISQNNKK